MHNTDTEIAAMWKIMLIKQKYNDGLYFSDGTTAV